MSDSDLLQASRVNPCIAVHQQTDCVSKETTHESLTTAEEIVKVEVEITSDEHVDHIKLEENIPVKTSQNDTVAKCHLCEQSFEMKGL